MTDLQYTIKEKPVSIFINNIDLHTFISNRKISNNLLIQSLRATVELNSLQQFSYLLSLYEIAPIEYKVVYNKKTLSDSFLNKNLLIATILHHLITDDVIPTLTKEIKLLYNHYCANYPITINNTQCDLHTAFKKADENLQFLMLFVNNVDKKEDNLDLLNPINNPPKIKELQYSIVLYAIEYLNTAKTNYLLTNILSKSKNINIHCIMYAIFCGNTHAIHYILQNKLAHPLDKIQQNKQSLGLLDLAISKANIQVVKSILHYMSHDDIVKSRALTTAINFGNTKVIKEVLKNHPNLEEIDGCGYTPLILSLKLNKPTVFHLLLKHGANPYIKDEDNENILVKAIQWGRKSIVLYILRHFKDIRIDEVDIVNQYSTLDYLIINNMCKSIYKEVNLHITTLHDEAYIKKMINTPKASGDIPLIFAIKHHNHIAFDYLIKWGADVHYVNNANLEIPHRDLTLLSYAVLGDNLYAAKKLIDKHVDVNAFIIYLYRCNVLFLAKSVEMANLLVEAKTDSNLKNFLGETAFDTLSKTNYDVACVIEKKILHKDITSDIKTKVKKV